MLSSDVIFKLVSLQAKPGFPTRYLNRIGDYKGWNKKLLRECHKGLGPWELFFSLSLVFNSTQIFIPRAHTCRPSRIQNRNCMKGTDISWRQKFNSCYTQAPKIIFEHIKFQILHFHLNSLEGQVSGKEGWNILPRFQTCYVQCNCYLTKPWQSQKWWRTIISQSQCNSL